MTADQMKAKIIEDLTKLLQDARDLAFEIQIGTRRIEDGSQFFTLEPTDARTIIIRINGGANQ